MADQAKDGLLSSLKGLYNNPEFSDLKIESQTNTYHAHKAILCTRSKYFAEECRNGSGQDGVLSFHKDDPRAIEMIVRFFYYLDYYTEKPDGVSRVNGYTNGYHQKEEPINGAAFDSNGVSYPEQRAADSAFDVPVSEPTAEPNSHDSLDDFLPISPVKAKNKKKKRKKSMAQPSVEPEPVEPETASPAVQEPPSKLVPTRSWSEQVEEAIEEEQHDGPAVETDLVLHARVYALSRKYGIEPLQVLALERFQSDAEKQWDSGDFLQAAKEVYTSPDGDRQIKDIIIGIVYEHPGLLDKEENQNIIEGLTLSYDLLMHMRKQGKL